MTGSSNAHERKLLQCIGMIVIFSFVTDYDTGMYTQIIFLKNLLKIVFTISFAMIHCTKKFQHRQLAILYFSH